MFYSLDCIWNLTLDFFQTNLWILIPNNIPSGVRYYTYLAKPHLHVASHSWQDTWGQKSFDSVWTLTHLHLKEMKQVWCSWDWSGIPERHKEGDSVVNFTLLHLLFFPDIIVRLIQALPMASLPALKHLCKELWKQIAFCSVCFFLYPFQRSANRNCN